MRNGAINRPKIRDGAINSAKVENHSLTGADINLSTLPVTRIAHRISGTQTVTAPPSGTLAAYPLSNNRYRQPAGTTDVFFGTARVRFPAGCTPFNGSRWAVIEILVDGHLVGSKNAEAFGTGQVTTEEGFTAFTSGLVAKVAHDRHVTARAFGICGSPTDPHPQVLAVNVEVVRFG